MSYATVEQYIARYGEVADEAMLQECLDDASAVIDAALARAHKTVDTEDEAYMRALMSVCRSMTNRIMPTETDIPAGATSWSMGAVGFTESVGFATTYGTPKPLKSELDLLGLSGNVYRPVLAYSRADWTGRS